MRDFRFWLKLALFGSPFLMLVTVAWLTSAHLGEGLLFSEVNRRQLAGEITIYEPAWQRVDEINFKMYSLWYRRPLIAVVGSSRARLVDSGIFNLNPDAFFNASVSALEIADLNEMVQYWAREDTLPQYLFLQIDLPRLHAPFREAVVTSETLSPFYELTVIATRTHETLSNWFFNRDSVFESIQLANQYPTVLGAGGLSDLSGYRNDGSFHYIDIGAAIPYRLQVDRESFLSQQLLFQSGDTVDQLALGYYGAILETAQRHGVVVIGYVPPFRNIYYWKMQASGDYGYINRGMVLLQETFTTYDMPLYDFRLMTSFGGSDDELYDAWHPGMLANARMYQVMLQDLPALAPYVDLEQLRQDIQNSPDNFYPFGQEP